MQLSVVKTTVGAVVISMSVVATAGATTFGAVPISGQGTWETTLQGRDLDGNAATFEAYYDTSLDISWLADADVTGTHFSWEEAKEWAANLDVYGVKGWRLPNVMSVSGGAYNKTRSYDGSTDEGFALPTTDGNDGGWRDSSGNPVSEMGHMHYVTLGNLGKCDPNLPATPLCTIQTGPISPFFTNSGPFSNIRLGYWSDSEPSLNNYNGLRFLFEYGSQDRSAKINGESAWAVHSGDVGNPPLPAIGMGVLGDYVWRDDNTDGIQSPGEPGMVNVAVELQTCSGDLVTTTATDTTGHFSFKNVAPAFFQMQFKLPVGYSFSPEKSSDLFKLDSNANVNTGVTPCFDMSQGWKRLAIDAGMVPDVQTGSTPSMTLAISANGTSTLKPGPVLVEGNAVNWTYTISNTGDTVLNNIAINGRQKIPTFGNWAALCRIGMIQPGSTGSCSTIDTAAIVGTYKILIAAKADSSDGTSLQSVLPAFYKGEAGTPPPADNDLVTLKNAIYLSGSKKLWIRATSDASPTGSAGITAKITVEGVERALGTIGWKADKGFYQQVFFEIASAPSSIALSSDLGGSASGSITVK